MLYNSIKNEIRELFNSRDIKCFPKNDKLSISQIEKIKLKVYQMGISDSMRNIKITENIVLSQELIHIFKEKLEKQPNNEELLWIDELVNIINKTYHEGFYEGDKIRCYFKEVES